MVCNDLYDISSFFFFTNLFFLAIITSHNVIAIHSQLIRFPNIAFFTSPIPLHIAAMVILYGHISKVECLPFRTALEDVWLALDMIPRIRWRWERKDVNGGHPLIAKLVERVMGVNLHTVIPANPSVLVSEPDWDEVNSPIAKSSQHNTPILSATPGNYTPTSANSGGPVVYGPHLQRSMNGLTGPVNRSNSGGSTPPDKLVEMPDGLFYPFFPEAHVAAIASVPTSNSSPGDPASSTGHDYTRILKAAAAAQGGYGGTYAPEDRGGVPAEQQGAVGWSGVVRGS